MSLRLLPDTVCPMANLVQLSTVSNKCYYESVATIFHCIIFQKAQSHLFLYFSSWFFPDAFKSIKGRKTVNVLLRDQDDQFLQPSKIIVKVPKNETAARAGLLFLLDCDNLSKEELSNWLSKFDTWTMSDWEQWCDGERGNGDTPAVNLLTYFESEKEM